MWWLIGFSTAFFVVGTVVAGAVMGPGPDGDQGVDHSEKVQRAFAAVHGRRVVPIAWEREGPVLIRGKVAPRHAPLRSPFSRRDCVYYADSLGLRDAQSFLVTDETGTALVAFDKRAEVVFAVPRDRASGNRGVAASAAYEAAIFVGDEVSVAGVGRREVAPDGESSGPRSAPMRYVVRADPDGLLGILKRGRAG